jgi:hypothetical protein
MRSGVRSAFRLAKKSARADEGDALAGEEICQQTHSHPPGFEKKVLD